jgi:hypothetical protein
MRQRILLAVLIGVVGIIGCVAYVVTVSPLQPRPGSYRAAVMRVLKEQRVDYGNVTVVDGCAPSYHFCHTYAGTVQVLAPTPMAGRIDCRERWTTCTLTIPQAGIRETPLDDVLDPLAVRWEAMYGRLMLWVREVYGSTP